MVSFVALITFPASEVWFTFTLTASFCTKPSWELGATVTCCKKRNKNVQNVAKDLSWSTTTIYESGDNVQQMFSRPCLKKFKTVSAYFFKIGFESFKRKCPNLKKLTKQFSNAHIRLQLNSFKKKKKPSCVFLQKLKSNILFFHCKNDSRWQAFGSVISIPSGR